MSQPLDLDLLNQVLQWRNHQMGEFQERELNLLDFHSIIAGVLCFLGASISSAGGVGGGALFLPILNLVAGLELKRATTFSAFMVTGGAVSNVLYNLFFKDTKYGGKSLIDYEISLLSEPCMLLGVSIGVICNVIFPVWLITLLFVLLLAFSTFKTCRAGLLCWKAESDEERRSGFVRLGCEDGRDERFNIGEGENGMEKPLLKGKTENDLGIPVKKMVVLLMVWLSFFVLHVLRGDADGKSVIQITPCGVEYWLITLSQIPLAVIFTAYILFDNRSRQHQVLIQQEPKDFVAETTIETLPKFIFPMAALLSGILGGLFGIGGGLIMNPVLLHIGIPPQITAATSSFMVLFSSSMSSVQYLMLGMKGVSQALVLSVVCFVASLIGLVIIQRAVRRYRRASLIIFSVSTVMALSTVSITCFGAIDVWREYRSGQFMGFKLPC